MKRAICEFVPPHSLEEKQETRRWQAEFNITLLLLVPHLAYYWSLMVEEICS
jgi:hypothetical protein